MTGGADLTLGADGLDLLMPMHLRIDPEGRITGTGRAMRVLAGAADLEGTDFFDRFTVNRPSGIVSADDLHRRAGAPLAVTFSAHRRIHLRGHLVPGLGGEAVLNLALGLGDLPDLGGARLTAQDFAPTDPTVDMLYLLEAKGLAFSETHRLIARLQGDKSRAEEAAMTDALTGLRNRRALDLVLARTIADGLPFALCQVDLDYFKSVNDTHGHAAGDTVLQHVAQRLTGIVRASDTVARVGGDEFVLVFPDLVDEERLGVIAGRIVEGLERPVSHEGHLCRISASIGIALSTAYEHPDPERMIADADEALYRSKIEGRARHNFHGRAAI